MPLSAYTWDPLTVPFAPLVEPGGPNGDSETRPASAGVPSPHVIVAVWVSAVPLSLNVAGARLRRLPSSTVRSIPAFTVGATLLTVTVYVPLSAKTWDPLTVPEPPASTTVPVSAAVPSPQLIVAECVSSVPTSENVAGARETRLPSSAVLLAPASTAGATLLTLMVPDAESDFGSGEPAVVPSSVTVTETL